MKAVNGGSVENAGTINMAAGSAGTGIYVDGKSTFYNNASGKIVFAGGQTQSGTITGDTSAGSVDICDDGGSCANKFIHLEQGATLQNSGTMITSASFKLNEMAAAEFCLPQPEQWSPATKSAAIYMPSATGRCWNRDRKTFMLTGML